MASILSENEKNNIIALFEEKSEITTKEIASELNLPIESVRAIKAHYTRGSYERFMLNVSSESEFAISLSMERDLQSFLLNDLSKIESGLRLNENGREFKIEVGRIDILAIDKKGNLVVIELKAGKAKDDALGQLLGYMGFVKEKIANGKKVRGIIIANEFEERLRYAVKDMNNIELKAYSVNFTFANIKK